LEQFAYSYIYASESFIKVTSFIFLFFGTFISYKINKSILPIRRAVYFFMISVLVLALAFERFIWLLASYAIEGDVLYILVLIEFGLFILLGYLFGFAATGRSLDAYGTPSKWWLTYIPLANFLLLFKPSLNTHKTDSQKLGWTLNAALILAAFIMIMAGRGFAIFIERLTIEHFTTAINSMPRVADKLNQAAIQNSRIENFLVLMANEVKPPIVIDEVTTLSKVSVNGKKLDYYYIVSGNINELPDSFAPRLIQKLCTGKLKQVISQGATISATYTTTEGMHIKTISVDQVICHTF